MSALGQKQTLGKVRPMSALPPKADIGTHSRDVCFVPKADMTPLLPISRIERGRSLSGVQQKIQRNPRHNAEADVVFPRLQLVPP